MITEISKFIYNNKIYSKCSKEEKDQIDKQLNDAKNMIINQKRTIDLMDEEGQDKCDKIKELSEENKRLMEENKQLLERIKRLEARL